MLEENFAVIIIVVVRYVTFCGFCMVSHKTLHNKAVLGRGRIGSIGKDR